MTASEDEIIRDQNERSRLQKAIADVETALRVSTPGTRRILEMSLEGIKGRIATLDKKISDAVAEREAQAGAEVARVAMLAQKEARLSEGEKQTYSGFLAKEFFTKQDFKSLDQFYSNAWDRLSENGKEEMSHRVWEGIRHDQYRFTDLPKVVREKEEDRVYQKLSNPDKIQGSLKQIPDGDRADFLRAYETGKREESAKVLNRDSFRRNVSLETSTGEKHRAATIGGMADDHGVLVETASKSVITPPETSAMTSVHQTAAALKNLTLVDVASISSIATLPNATAPGFNERSPA